jgi:hypothetical protein
MIFKTANLTIKNFECKVDLDLNRSIALITPILSAECKQASVLIGSLKIDDHEMIPAIKIILETGINRVELKNLKIINPLIVEPEDAPGTKQYKITLDLYLAPGQVESIDKMIEIKR